MANALRNHATAVELFGQAHFVRIAIERVEHVADKTYASCLVGFYSLMQLLEAQFHVVKVRNGFAKRFFEVDEHLLKVAESLPAAESTVVVYFLPCYGIGYKKAHAPITILGIAVVGKAVGGLDKLQAFAVNILLMLCLQLVAYMTCYHINVVLQQVYIGKYGVVNAL